MNDNLYKVLLVLFLLKISARTSSFILGVTSLLFVLPFLLLASFSGSLSDKYSKSNIIFVTRIIEIVAVILGVICFYYKYILGCYLVLLILGIHTAIFSPAKFGILPELVSVNVLSNANGIMTSVTYIASILGTFTASFFTQITQYRFFETSLVCVFLALFGFFWSLKIKKTPAQSPSSEIKWEFLTTIISTMQITYKRRFLLSSMLLGAIFFFLATSVQLNIVAFVYESLGLPPFVGGYLLVATSLGIGLGAFFAGKVSKSNIELAFTPIMGLGLGLSLCCLFFVQHNIYLIIFVLFFLGIFGGAFIVPLHAFVQYASPNRSRGKNIAVANFLDFSGMLLASLSVFIFSGIFHFQIASIFFVLGIFSIVLSFLLFFLWGDQVLRFVCGFFIKMPRDFFITDLPISSNNFFLADIKNKFEALIFFVSLPKRIRIILSPSLKKYSLFRIFSWLCSGLFLKRKQKFSSQINLLENFSKNMDVICLIYNSKQRFDYDFINEIQKKASFWTFFSLNLTNKRKDNSLQMKINFTTTEKEKN